MKTKHRTRKSLRARQRNLATILLSFYTVVLTITGGMVWDKLHNSKEDIPAGAQNLSATIPTQETKEIPWNSADLPNSDEILPREDQPTDQVTYTEEDQTGGLAIDDLVKLVNEDLQFAEMEFTN